VKTREILESSEGDGIDNMVAQLGKERSLDPGQGIGEAKRSKRKKIEAFQQRPNNDTVDCAQIIIIETLRNLNLSAKPFTHVHLLSLRTLTQIQIPVRPD
jgi:hypothetical protein